MARLYTTGFESGSIPTATGTINEGFYRAGTVANSTTIRHLNSGVSTRIAATTSYWQNLATTTTNGQAHFARFYVYFDGGLPTVSTDVCRVLAGASLVARVVVNTSGGMALLDSTGTQIGATSSNLSTGTWYRIELKTQMAASPTTSNGTAELKINGTTLSSTTSGNLGTAAITQWRFGIVNGTYSGTWALHLDDIAINNDQGTGQNTWPGEGCIVHLRPVADAARGNWTAGAGGTTSLYEAVNNVPPVGVSAATNTSQIRNNTSGLNQYATFTTETYTTAGIGASDTVMLLQPVARVAQNTTGTVPGGIQVTANPAGAAEKTFNYRDAGANVNTEPSGWRGIDGNIDYLPTVTKGTGATLRINKNAALTTIAYASYFALQVEYQPAVPLTVSVGAASETETAGTVSPASSSVKINTLTDDFTTLNSSVWATQTGTPVIESGRLKLTSASVSTEGSGTNYDLTSSSVYFRPYPATGYVTFTFRLANNLDLTDYVEMRVVDGFLYTSKSVNGVVTSETEIGYLPNLDQWWRIRESAGTIRFETTTNDSGSPLESGWFQHNSTATDIPLTNLRVVISAADTTTPSYFDGLNATANTFPTTVAVNAATETDTAQTVTPVLSSATLTVAVNAATETDTASTVTPVKTQRVTVTGSTETDTSAAVSPLKPQRVTVTGATEADTAATISPLKTQRVTVAGAAETDTASTVTPVKTQRVTVTEATETDAGATVAPLKPIRVTVTGSTETDTAQSVTALKALLTGVSAASESDAAGLIAPVKYVAVGTALPFAEPPLFSTQSDFASVVAAIKTQYVVVTGATETDTADSVAVLVPIGITVAAAAETDTASSVSPVKTQYVAVIGATETDTAGAFTLVKYATVTGATETDSAEIVGVQQAVVTVVGAASETDTAQAVTPFKVAAVTEATETDTAGSIGSSSVVSISQATETDTAQTVSVYRVVGASAATESDTAGSVVAQKIVPVLATSETNDAHTIIVSDQGVVIQVGTAAETDSAGVITVYRIYHFSIEGVTEIQTALKVRVLHSVSGAVVSETGGTNLSDRGQRTVYGSAGLTSVLGDETSLVGNTGRTGVS